jgi:predicted DNA repair protein MutK
VQRNSIAAVWIGGLVLAVALYAIGPDRFVEACLDLMNGIDTVFRNLVLTLGVQVFGIVRALAIAIYAVFFVLASLSIARGSRGVWALIVVTVIFVMLVGRPDGDFSAPVGRWILALALVLTGAAIMTQRLLAPRFSRGVPPPYPPGYRP